MQYCTGTASASSSWRSRHAAPCRSVPDADVPVGRSSAFALLPVGTAIAAPPTLTVRSLNAGLALLGSTLTAACSTPNTLTFSASGVQSSSPECPYPGPFTEQGTLTRDPASASTPSRRPSRSRVTTGTVTGTKSAAYVTLSQWHWLRLFRQHGTIGFKLSSELHRPHRDCRGVFSVSRTFFRLSWLLLCLTCPSQRLH